VTSSATVSQPGAGPFLTYLFKVSTTVEDVAETIGDNWIKIVALGVGLSTIANFSWMVFLFFFAGIAVYIALWLVGLLLGTISLLSFVKAGYLTEYVALAVNSSLAALDYIGEQTDIDVDSDVAADLGAQATDLLATSTEFNDYYKTAGIAFGVAFILFVLICCIARKNIAITIALISESTQAMRNSKAMVFLPIFISTFQLAVLAFTAVVLVYVAVMGSGEAYDQHLADLTHSYSEVSETLEQMAVQVGIPGGVVSNVTSLLHLGAISQSQEQIFFGGYSVFAFFWTYYTLGAIMLICISANVFYFYFVDKDTVPEAAYMDQFDDNQTDWPVTKFLGYTLRFHIGTAAFGAFVLTAVTAFQAATKALFESMKKSQGEGNMIKLVEICVQYCLWCFKKSIEFINSYAYVYVFMENVGFCTACFHTFGMITSNPIQIGINKVVQLMLSLVQSVTTPLVCAFASYYSFNGDKYAATTSSFAVLVVTATVFIVSLLMTKAFVQVYSQVVQSMTVFALYDVKEYSGRFTRPTLRKAFSLEEEDKEESKEESKPSDAQSTTLL